MGGGGDQNALADGGRTGEEDSFNYALGLVEYVILPLARPDSEAIQSGLGHDLIGMESGTVDNPSAMEGTPIGVHADDALSVPWTGVLLHEAQGLSLQKQHHFIDHRVLGRGDGEQEGVHDASCGSPQGAEDLGGEGWLRAAHLVPGDDLQPWHAVAPTALPQILKRPHFPLREGYYVVPLAAVGDIQLRAELGIHFVAQYVEPGLVGAGEGIIAGMDDGCVALGGSSAHVGGFL